MALIGGLMAFKRGDQRQSQLFQRARVGLQLSTIIAIVAGGMMATSKKTPPPASSE